MPGLHPETELLEHSCHLVVMVIYRLCIQALQQNNYNKKPPSSGTTKYASLKEEL
jgi:hypothetical protein